FGLAAVPLFLAACQGQFAFGDAVAKIYAQRNKRQTFLLRLADQFLDFLTMQKEPAARKRFMIERTAGTVLRDVTIHQPDAGTANFGVGISQVSLAFAQRFYLGACQGHAGLHLLEQVIVVGGGAI